MPASRAPAPPAASYAPPLPAAPPAPPAEPACANCGTSAPLAYCPACGQEQHDLHRSVRSLFADLLDTFAGWDGKLLATFRALLLRPGGLTCAFLDGRRARYLRPLRVYLTASGAFFLVLSSDLGRDNGEAVRVNFGNPSAEVATATERPSRARARPPEETIVAARVARPARAGSRVDAMIRRFEARYRERKHAWWQLPEAERKRRLSEAFLGHLGATLFVLLPIFALLSRVLWRRRGLFYAEHLVFALHAHAAAMVGLAAVRIAPGGWATVPALWVPGYAALAVRRVFGRGRERRRWTAVKLAVLATAYGLILGVALLATLLVALFDGV